MSVRHFLAGAAAVGSLFFLGAGPVGQPDIPNTAAVKALAAGQYKHIHRSAFAAFGDGGEADYYWSASNCTLQTGLGDNGSQIKPNAGTGCWLLSPRYPLNPAIWGITGTATYYVRAAGAGGNDHGGANTCLVLADPCLTWQRAADQIYSMIATSRGGAHSVINVGAGTFSGGFMSGRPPMPGSATSDRGGIEITGAGPGVTFFNAGNSLYPLLVFVLQGGASGTFDNLTVTVPASGGVAFFAQDSGSYITFGGPRVEVVGADNTSIAFHNESNSTIEVPGNQLLGLKGTFFDVFNPDNHSNQLIDGAAITCTGALAFTNFVNAGNGSSMHVAPGTSYTGCGSATGDLVQSYNGGYIRNDGAQFPGNGYIKSDSINPYYPPYRPTLGACLNATISGNSSNYAMFITLTGANAVCNINLGKPAAPAAGYFTGGVVCSAAISTNGAARTVIVTQAANLIALTPSAAGANGDAYTVLCHPLF
jgi:hypothetical protein